MADYERITLLQQWADRVGATVLAGDAYKSIRILRAIALVV